MPLLILRISISLLLIAVLFGATMHNEELYVLLGQFWHRLFAAVGLSHVALLEPTGAIGQVTRRPRDIPAIVSYSLLYIGLCLTLLFVLLPAPAQRKLVLQAYGFAGIISIVLVIASKIGGQSMTTLNNELIHFVVSPMPVIMLAPLVRWYLPANGLSKR